MSSFAELLKAQRQATSLETTKSAAQGEVQRKSYGPDERIWKPAVDRAGNGFAVIRFLPSPDVDAIPWVKYFDHGFKGDSGRWFIENCPTTIKQPCPVCEQNSRYWSSGNDDDKEIARARKRRVHFLSNILVIRDQENPDNEGKVFLYNYGNKIFQKITEVMDSPFEDEPSFDPFNVFTGADFKIKIKQVGGYWNYDSSEFTSQKALFDSDEEKIVAVLEQSHSLNEFVDPSAFKTYNELKEKFVNVTDGGDDRGGSYTPRNESSWNAPEANPQPMKSAESSFQAASTPSKTESDDNEEDDDLAYFKKLAEQYDG